MTHNTREVEEVVDKKLKQISNYIFSRSISLQDSAKYERQVWIDTLHHQLQKARQDWLRSEIEKLETVENELAKLQGWLGTVAGSQTDSTISQKPSKDVQDAKALHTSIIMTAKDKIKPIQTTLTSIITRYKEELLELEKGV